MQTGNVYLGERDGERIFRYGNGAYTQEARTGDIGFIFGYQLELQSWPVFPFGNHGEGVFRWVTALLKHSNGYHVRLTAYVDELEITFKDFAGGPAPGGTLSQVVRCPLWLQLRGNRLAFALRSLALSGEFELVDVLYQPILIRMGP